MQVDEAQEGEVVAGIAEERGKIEMVHHRLWIHNADVSQWID